MQCRPSAYYAILSLLASGGSASGNLAAASSLSASAALPAPQQPSSPTAPALPSLGSCSFSSAEVGLTYDLSPVRGVAYTTSRSGGEYSFVLCAALPSACSGAAASAAQLDPLSPGGTGCLASLGAASQAEAVPFAPNASLGVKLTYFGGAACGPPPGAFSTVFSLACDTALAPGVLAVDAVVPPDLGACELLVSARAAAACPTPYVPLLRGLGAGYIALAAAVAAAVLYCGGGAAIRRARGAQGVEALPHIGTLRACSRACCGGGGAKYVIASSSDEAGGGDYAAMLPGDGAAAGGGVDARALHAQRQPPPPPPPPPHAAAMSSF